MCNKEEQANCEIEIDDLEWACRNCKKRTPDEIGTWTHHLLDIRRLQVGGYPFRANDLSIEEWSDLGIINDLIGQLRQEQGLAGVMRLFSR